MRNKGLLYILASLFVFISCDSDRVFDDYKSVPDQWHKDSIIAFKFNPKDSSSVYDLYVNIRNTNAYKFNNIFLIVEMNFPHGKTTVDTLEYKMANANGEFLGTGFTSVKENKLVYKENQVFNEAGEYLVNIQHAMRENGKVNGIVNLEGISDVGFRVERSANN